MDAVVGIAPLQNELGLIDTNVHDQLALAGTPGGRGNLTAVRTRLRDCGTIHSEGMRASQRS